MKKYRKLMIWAIVALAGVGGVAAYVKNLEKNGVVTFADIMATVNKVSIYFVPFVLFLAVLIAILIIFRKKDKKIKFWLRWESAIAVLIALVITLNVVFVVPMGSLFNLQYAQLGKITTKTIDQGNDVTRQIGNEGTVLLKNTNDYLPVKDTHKLNVFGWASTNPVYGGTGSGNVNTANAIDINKSLKNAGFQTNNELSSFYTKYRKTRPENTMMAQDWTLPEPKATAYSDKILANAKKYSDTAMVVISRVGGEGADLPKDMKASGITYKGNKGDFKEGDTYLQLSKSERDMIRMVNDNFKNIVVVVNSANPLELGWLNQYDHIKGALWMAGPGAQGFSSLGKILNGQVNPSGRTVDTYAYDLKSTPSFNNFGDFGYENSKYKYVNYSENIYVGYKFYETYYLNNNNAYKKAVQFPFGYGLSYTSFDQKMSNIESSANGTIRFSVTVKNTGKRSGKDVVQAYYTAPYTNGGAEKAATNLIDFAKTKNLRPGESQKILFKLNRDEMASYNTNNGGAYVLDKGDYKIQLKANAHDVLDSKNYKVAETVNYNPQNKRSSDKNAASNEFSFAKGNAVYLSRKDNFANAQTALAAPTKQKLSSASQKGLTDATDYKPVNEKNDKMPTTGASGSLKLAELRHKSYDDRKWDQLLDQLSVRDMNRLITYGGYQTLRINSVDKLHTYDFDGPAGLSSFFVKNMNATAFPSATLIAASWNKDLAKKRGESVGKQAEELGVSGWYGPAMNIHRSPFSGRNFEYYSEDGVLSGYMGASEISGAREHGVYSYMKHFALNDQETNRLSKLLTWSTEQAIREIYLKPFEMSVKDGKANAAMSSFNYIGNKWAGGNSALLNNVLRNEWGFRGLVKTDYFGGYGFMQGDKALRNGNDIMLSTTGESGAGITGTNQATTVKAMRKASHNILYTVVNSNAYDKKQSDQSSLLPWQQKLIKYNIIIAVIIVLLQALVIFIYRRKYIKNS